VLACCCDKQHAWSSIMPQAMHSVTLMTSQVQPPPSRVHLIHRWS
jgi:hypothetical protein